MSELDAMAAELERAAELLRAGDLDHDAAAALVERCADLASALGSELERESRAVPAEFVPGQERLVP
ncbi:MAG: hypothetical protein ACR2LY_01835 [Thermoleophilaceae bacterium]